MKTTKAYLPFFLIFICFTQCFAAIGPLSNNHGFKGYFYPYHGATLIYWVLYPYNYNPANEYPVIVWQPGSGHWPRKTDAPGHPNVIAYVYFSKCFYDSDLNEYTQLAKDYPCFIIVPVPREADTESNLTNVLWTDYNSSYRAKIYQDPVDGPVVAPNEIGWVGIGARLPSAQPPNPKNLYDAADYDGPDGWYGRAVVSLMKDISKEGFQFYTLSDCSAPDTTAPSVEIDDDKIYYIGFSASCITGSTYLTAGRDLFAGAILIDAYQSYAFATYQVDWYHTMTDAQRVEWSEKLASRYNHIPIILTSGNGTPCSSDFRGLYDESTDHFAQLHAVDSYNNKFFVVGDGWCHTTVAVNTINSETSGWRFDVINHGEQWFAQVPEDATHLSPFKWLMQQASLPKEEIPPDPYPNESYWKDNVHDSVPNKSRHVYEYLHHNSWAKVRNQRVNYYEVVDRETQAVLSIGNKEIKIELDGNGNLIWDKGGNFEHTFSDNNQSYVYIDSDLAGMRVITNSGGYKDNQQFEVTYSSPRVYNATADKEHVYIQDAINNANNGDEIVVYPGTYYESVNFNGKNITVRSSDPNNWDVVAATVIDGNGAANTVLAYARLSGFTITGGTCGVYCSSGSPVVSNCVIRNNSDKGVKVFGCTPTIKNCIIRNNGGEGIYVCPGGFTVTNNAIYDNNGGLYFQYGGGTVRNNTIVNNTNYGIRTGTGGSPSISNCILWGNNDDLSGCTATYSCIENNDVGAGNIHSDPCFVDADNNDFHIGIHSPCVNAGKPDGNYPGEKDIDGDARIIGSYVDMGADEVIVPVADAHQWGLDEKTGVTARDSVGATATNGTFNGNDPCWVTGLIGGAVDFNGVSDYFTIPGLNPGTHYNNLDTFTVAGWFKTSKSTGMQTIIGQWGQITGPVYFGWQVLVENNKVVARFGPPSSIPTNITGTSVVTNGNWHYFTLVYPTKNSNATLYVDGNSEGTPGAKPFSVGPTSCRIGDGSYVGSGTPVLKGGPFCGMIDDVMIFNRALTADEVWQLYAIGQ